MNRLRRILRPSPPEDSSTSIDLEQEVAGGLADPVTARRSIARLQRERKELIRRRRAVERGFKRLSRARTALIAKSSPSLEIQVYQFSEALRDANKSDRPESTRKEQLAPIVGRIRVIDDAIARLRQRQV